MFEITRFSLLPEFDRTMAWWSGRSLRSDLGFDDYFAKLDKHIFEVDKNEGGAPTFCCVWCWEELAEYGSKACGHVFGCASCIKRTSV